MGAKSNDSVRALFANYSRGVMTNRDAWAYNAGQAKVQANMTRMIGFYNAEVQRCLALRCSLALAGSFKPGRRVA